MKGKNDPILLEGPSNPARALVILALYRRGAEGLLKEWRDQIVSQFAGNQSIDMLELSMVDLQVCSYVCRTGAAEIQPVMHYLLQQIQHYLLQQMLRFLLS